MYLGGFSSRWQIVFLPIIIGLFGCAAKPTVELHLVPINSSSIQIDTEIGSATLVQKGVQVTLEPLDEVELFDLTKGGEINPYLYFGRWGEVEPLYTVFEILVHNTEHERVSIDESAVLIDGSGNQYASLTYDYFRDLFANSRTSITYQNRYYRPYNYYDPYYSNTHSYLARSRSHRRSPAAKSARLIVRDTIFDGGHIFEGGKRVGFLVFNRLPEDAKHLRVIIPQVVIHDDNDEVSNLDFHFDFQQEIAVQP